MTALSFSNARTVVVGPGIVGMPMAALLADATRRLDDPPGEVVVVQRNSPTSGWKVDAINRGESPIGGVEPDLDRLVAINAAAGTLRASHSWDEVSDADTILVCVQTDKLGMGPDYGPMYEALHGIATALATGPRAKRPMIVIESTLAPSTMQSIVRPLFASHGLLEGRDIMLGNSPNRVMPGRLVERVASADKIVGALNPATASRIAELYGRIVTNGRLLQTSSLTAEVVKTLENAYRDVRIAFAAELVRWCDANDIAFFDLRDQVNTCMARTDDASADGTAVPSGALLVPTVGVGGHCLPKDGILLWWRAAEGGVPTTHSLILGARHINDESPRVTLDMARRMGAPIAGQRVAVLGAAYRPDSEDTRNAPALQLALRLREAGADIIVHDPYVRAHDANIARLGLAPVLTKDLEHAVRDADVVFVANGHSVYKSLPEDLGRLPARSRMIIDAANLFQPAAFAALDVRYGGIGRGQQPAPAALVDSVLSQFGAMETGVANEVAELSQWLNTHHADGVHNEVLFADVQALARTCATGCDIVSDGPVHRPFAIAGFESELARKAFARWGATRPARRESTRERRRGTTTRTAADA